MEWETPFPIILSLANTDLSITVICPRVTDSRKRPASHLLCRSAGPSFWGSAPIPWRLFLFSLPQDCPLLLLLLLQLLTAWQLSDPPGDHVAPLPGPEARQDPRAAAPPKRTGQNRGGSHTAGKLIISLGWTCQLQPPAFTCASCGNFIAKLPLMAESEPSFRRPSVRPLHLRVLV